MWVGQADRPTHAWKGKTMEWINAGASQYSERFKSKAAFKRALKEAPQLVVLDTTGQFPTREFTVIASDLGNRANIKGESWSICGPDPYLDRKWYATVTVNHLGNLKVT